MRKLKLQVQMSIDGFMAGPGGELDWLTSKWDTELKKYVFNLTRPVDCIVLGKNLAYNFIENWEKRLTDPATSDAFTRKMAGTQKVVFSKTLERVTWKNTKLAGGDLYEEIMMIKKSKGRDIIAYGGLSFLSSLIQTGLVDEYNFFVNPVVLGEGRSIFRGPDRLKLDLVYSTHFDCGITALCYIPLKKSADPRAVGVITDSAGI